MALQPPTPHQRPTQTATGDLCWEETPCKPHGSGANTVVHTQPHTAWLVPFHPHCTLVMTHLRSLVTGETALWVVLYCLRKYKHFRSLCLNFNVCCPGSLALSPLHAQQSLQPLCHTFPELPLTSLSVERGHCRKQAHTHKKKKVKKRKGSGKKAREPPAQFSGTPSTLQLMQAGWEGILILPHHLILREPPQWCLVAVPSSVAWAEPGEHHVSVGDCLVRQWLSLIMPAKSTQGTSYNSKDQSSLKIYRLRRI